jgi:hypothetical protein
MTGARTAVSTSRACPSAAGCAPVAAGITPHVGQIGSWIPGRPPWSEMMLRPMQERRIRLCKGSPNIRGSRLPYFTLSKDLILASRSHISRRVRHKDDSRVVRLDGRALLFFRE